MSKTKEASPVATAEEKVAEIGKDLSKFEKRQVGVSVIENDGGLASANEFLVDVKGRINRIKELKDEYVKPLKESVKKIESLFNTPLRSYEQIESGVKRAMSDYRLECEKVAKAEEERLRKLREAEAAKAKKQGKPAPTAPVATVERKEATMNTSAGKSTAKKVVKFEIVDANAIPKKYRDMVYLRAVERGLLDPIIRDVVKIDGMNTNVPGVRVYEDFDISVTA